jgi:23S rRNA (cytosine1962-C5)-methyltransferase
LKTDPPRRGGRNESSTPPPPVRLPGPTDYALLDSGGQQKLERFGPLVFVRPAAQAIWPPAQPALWQRADASFSRRGADNGWDGGTLPPAWIMAADGME